MPKVKLGAKKPDPLSEKLLGRIHALGLSLETVAPPQMCAITLSRRLKDPGKFTRDDLHHLARKLDIPIEEIRRLV